MRSSCKIIRSTEDKRNWAPCRVCQAARAGTQPDRPPWRLQISVQTRTHWGLRLKSGQHSVCSGSSEATVGSSLYSRKTSTPVASSYLHCGLDRWPSTRAQTPPSSLGVPCRVHSVAQQRVHTGAGGVPGRLSGGESPRFILLLYQCTT